MATIFYDTYQNRIDFDYSVVKDILCDINYIEKTGPPILFIYLSLLNI